MSVQASEIKILDQILLVDLSGIHLWTARKKLKPEMLEGVIPPAILASLGSMRVIDPDEIKPFEKLKRRAIKVVEDIGVRFLGGYAVPQDLIQEVVRELELIKSEFYDAKTSFLSRYDSLVDEWVSRGWEKQEWRDAIRSSITPHSVVNRGMQFGFAACRIAPDGDENLSKMLGSEVRGLSDQLFSDTVDTAEKLLDTGLASRGHVTQTTLNTIRKMNAKLKGLCFLSSDVRVLSTYITELLEEFPSSGVVSGVQYNQIVTLISSLSSESSIKRLIGHMNQASNGSVEEEDDEEITFPQKPRTQAVVQAAAESAPEVEAQAAPEPLEEAKEVAAESKKKGSAVIEALREELTDKQSGQSQPEQSVAEINKNEQEIAAMIGLPLSALIEAEEAREREERTKNEMAEQLAANPKKRIKSTLGIRF